MGKFYVYAGVVIVLAMLGVGTAFLFLIDVAPTEGTHSLVHEGSPEAAVGAAELEEIYDARRQRLLAEFDTTNLTVDEDDLIQGTDRKDQIQAVVDPDHSPIEAITELDDDDRMIAVTIGDVTVGYPLSILTVREIINDRVGDTPIAVTY